MDGCGKEDATLRAFAEESGHHYVEMAHEGTEVEQQKGRSTMRTNNATRSGVEENEKNKQNWRNWDKSEVQLVIQKAGRYVRESRRG